MNQQPLLENRELIWHCYENSYSTIFLFSTGALILIGGFLLKRFSPFGYTLPLFLALGLSTSIIFDDLYTLLFCDYYGNLLINNLTFVDLTLHNQHYFVPKIFEESLFLQKDDIDIKELAKALLLSKSYQMSSSEMFTYFLQWAKALDMVVIFEEGHIYVYK
jgi:hypothetical protein